MNCMNECLHRVYEYGPPKNLRTLDSKSFEFFPIGKDVTNYKEIVARAQAFIDTLPRTIGNCDEGCRCVPDAVQIKPYPRASEARTESGWLGMIRFDYTITFTTYTGQCDQIPPGFKSPHEQPKR